MGSLFLTFIFLNFFSELDDHPKYRKHISLLNASIPDDSLNSCITRFGYVFDIDFSVTKILFQLVCI